MVEDNIAEFVLYFDHTRMETRLIIHYKDGGSSETVDGQVRLYHHPRHSEPERMTLLEKNSSLETRTNFIKKEHSVLEEPFVFKQRKLGQSTYWVEDKSLYDSDLFRPLRKLRY